jgi:general secretion pathway protein J
MRRVGKGFTLVEVLAALVVLGLVVAGLGQGMRFGLQAWDRAAGMIEAGNTLDAVDRVLRHMVARMHPGGVGKPAPFAAGPASLGLVGMLPGMPPRRVEARLAVDAERRLVLHWRPYANAPRSRPAAITETVLLRGVARLELAYWRPDAGWSSAWEGSELPALIRIRLGFAAADHRRWPDIVVAPGLDRP